MSSRDRSPQGHRARAPYDVVLFGGAVAEVPSEITAQLAEDGRLVAVVKTERAASAAPLLMTRTGGVVARAHYL